MTINTGYAILPAVNRGFFANGRLANCTLLSVGWLRRDRRRVSLGRPKNVVESTDIQKTGSNRPNKEGQKMDIQDISAREIAWTNGGSCTFLLGFVRKTDENKVAILQKFGATIESVSRWGDFWSRAPELLPIGLLVFARNGDNRASRAFGPNDKQALIQDGARLLLEFGEGLNWEWEDSRGRKCILSLSQREECREGTPRGYCNRQGLQSVHWGPVALGYDVLGRKRKIEG